MTFLRFFDLVSILLMGSSFSSLGLKSCSIKPFQGRFQYTLRLHKLAIDSIRKYAR